MEFVGTWAPSTSRGEMGLGPQRNSVAPAVAVATCAPRSPDVLSAGEGVVDVGAAPAALCVKSLRSSSSNSYVVIHPAERALWRACTPCTNVGERRSRTSCSSYVVPSTERANSRKPSSMLPPTESTGTTAEPALMFGGKRRRGVGGWPGGRPPGAAGAPGGLVMSEFKFAPCRFHAVFREHFSIFGRGVVEKVPADMGAPQQKCKMTWANLRPINAKRPP